MSSNISLQPDLYLSGQVRRYHANHLASRLGQTNADHCWGVTVLILKLHPNPSMNLIKAAIFHDAGEKQAGDLPGYFKEDYPWVADEHAEIEHALALEIGALLPALTQQEADWLHMADKLESILFMKAYGIQPRQRLIDRVLTRAAGLGVALPVQQLIAGF